MHFNDKQRNSPSFTEGADFDEATDPGIDRMATQYIVDPNVPAATGGFAAPYINPTPTPALTTPDYGFRGGQTPQHTPPFNSPTGSFQKVPTGFIPSDQIAGELSSPGFQPPRTTGSFEQLSSAGMMSPGFQSPKTTGSFGQVSSAGMMSPGFQQPKVTGSFEALSSAGMMSPGFQPHTPPKPVTNLSPGIITKIRIRYALAAASCGAIIGLFLGILNTIMQGWQLSQGTPQLLGLLVLCTVAFGAIGYFRRERFDELLAQVGLHEVTEFLNRPAILAEPNSYAGISATSGSFQPPPSALYSSGPSASFPSSDPDRTDEFPIF